MGARLSRSGASAGRRLEDMQRSRTSAADAPEEAARRGLTPEVVRESTAVNDPRYLAAIRNASKVTGVQDFSGEWVERPREDQFPEGFPEAGRSSSRPLPRYRGTVVLPSYNVAGSATMPQIKAMLEDDASTPGGLDVPHAAQQYKLAETDVRQLLRHCRAPRLVREADGRLIGHWTLPDGAMLAHMPDPPAPEPRPVSPSQEQQQQHQQQQR